MDTILNSNSSSQHGDIERKDSTFYLGLLAELLIKKRQEQGLKVDYENYHGK